MSKSSHELVGQEVERLALFVSSITDYAIYMLTPTGEVASWNAGAQRFKGYTAQEIIGHHFSRFYTDEDRAAGVPVRALEEARHRGRFEAEGWRVRQDGSRFWAHVIIDAIRDEHGVLVGFAKVTRDITKQKVAADQLRDSERRFRILVQGVTDYAIYMISPSGEITNWNAGARRIKGFEQDEVVGTNFARFYSAEDQADGAPQRALARAAAEGRFEAEGWRMRKDGSRFWAHVVIDAIRNEHGELEGFAKVTRDITERRHAQAELEKAREALYQAQKMEAIGKVTGGVAHDFNNLLNVVNNGLALLRRTSTTAHDVRLIDTMDKALKRGATLVQQLLAFARQQPLVKEHKNLNRVISSFETVLQRAGRSGASFELNLADALPTVEIDTAQVETGLLNLVVNAYDAISVPGGRIIVSTQVLELEANQVRKLPAGRYVALSVADNGHGMPPQTIDRATEPFFTTKEVGKGTGLGLSQVYGMVQQSGGDLTIESEEGRGTVITLYFPVSQGGAEEHADSELETVLVVDDQTEVLDVTAELFKSLGFEVFSASSGEQALDVLKRTPRISLLVTDVVMGGMSGVELAKAASKLAPTLKVILASGYAGAAFATASGGKLEGFHFLSKPYRVNDIVRKLRALG
ncbi:PAS domain S-box protein [Aquabacterium sp.]|uniref:hybrid sensor histidine kinase/response regulator n=1 Tax=Aquabacterium sp. TaxID=1872578 RepID=UPI003D6D2154